MKHAWRFPEVMNAPFLLAVVVLVVNDHWLKGSGLLPGAVTGKTSDFAGLFFFPLLLVALARLALSCTGRLPRLHPGALALAVVATGAAFAAAKCTVAGADAYRAALGLVWGSVRFTADPTDLTALAVLPAAFWYGRRLCPMRSLSAAASTAA